jgi:hypothetical protein
LKHCAVALILVSIVLIAPAVFGQEKQQIIQYENLTGEPNRIADMTKAFATVTSNTNHLDLTLKVMPISKVAVFKNTSSYKWQNSELERHDYSKVTDVLALVVDYKTTEHFLGRAYITGITRVHKGIEAEILDGSMYYLAYSCLGFDWVMTKRSTDSGELLGLLLTGKGIVKFIWFIPALKAKYELVIPGSENKLLGTIKITVDSK